MTEAKKRSVVVQFFWLLRYRPAHAFRAVRSFLHFWYSHLVRLTPFGRLEGLTLGANVRLQRNGTIMAEAPHARISIGNHSVVYEDAKIEAYGVGTISIGENGVVGGVQIVSRYGIDIGDRFLCSWNVFIQDYDSHPVERGVRAKQVMKMVEDFRPRFGATPPTHMQALDEWNFPGEEIRIGNDVWIGANSTVLKGAQIGDGCIIATGSVVLRGDYPARSLIAGNPAVVVKQLPE